MDRSDADGKVWAILPTDKNPGDPITIQVRPIQAVSRRLPKKVLLLKISFPILDMSQPQKPRRSLRVGLMASVALGRCVSLPGNACAWRCA